MPLQAALPVTFHAVGLRPFCFWTEWLRSSIVQVGSLEKEEEKAEGEEEKLGVKEGERRRTKWEQGEEEEQQHTTHDTHSTHSTHNTQHTQHTQHIAHSTRSGRSRNTHAHLVLFGSSCSQQTLARFVAFLQNLFLFLFLPFVVFCFPFLCGCWKFHNSTNKQPQPWFFC